MSVYSCNDDALTRHVSDGGVKHPLAIEQRQGRHIDEDCGEPMEKA